MVKLQKEKSLPPFNEEVLCHLECILASSDFKASPQQIDLLEYVVKQTLIGNTDRIKGYTLATEVLGRGSDFDQSFNPIVSIQAGRLRQALNRYYLSAGKNDPIRIDIPKGSYVPIFREQYPYNPPIFDERAAPVSIIEKWPTLLVQPLKNLNGHHYDNYLSIGLMAELAHALSHYRNIRILEAMHQVQTTPWGTDCDFIMDGNIRRDPVGIRVAIRLRDAGKGTQIWSGKFQGDLEASKMLSFQEDVACEIAVRVAEDNAVISKHLSGISRNKRATELSTYEAMLRYWESASLLTTQSMRRALRALEHAVAQEPDCGQIWSMLADQYVNNYGLELVDLPTPLEKAAEYAEKGASLDPTNRRARMTLAYVRFMQNKLEEARFEAENAYLLCPESLFVLDVIGYLMTVSGEWDRGIELIEKSIRLNPYCRPWVRHAIYLNWFRLENYEEAYQETLYFGLPELFWDPLLKASACGHLEKIEEGQVHIQKLLSLKPDVAKRGRSLIGRYVKFENIADRIIEGLGKLGMRVED